VAAPATAVNATLEALSESGPVEEVVTLRTTLTFWLPEDVTREIVPEQVVAAAIPV